jgi:enamine deaminase RidA (YjgF/YER057c/UK114 family)
MPCSAGDGKGFAGDSVGEQTRQALENMKSVLEAAGSSLSCVAKTTVLMTDMVRTPTRFPGCCASHIVLPQLLQANYGAINEVYSE